MGIPYIFGGENLEQGPALYNAVAHHGLLYGRCIVLFVGIGFSIDLADLQLHIVDAGLVKNQVLHHESPCGARTYIQSAHRMRGKFLTVYQISKLQAVNRRSTQVVERTAVNDVFPGKV